MTVYEAEIHVVERGAGPAVVLVHGLGDDIRTWQATIDALAPTNRVIAFDMIGHGQSAKPPLNYRPATFADFLLGALDELRIERATFVGNSLGGWAAVLAALRRPDRVDRLVLVDSAGFANQPIPAVMDPGSLEDCRELLRWLFVDPKFADDPALAEEVLKTRVRSSDGSTIRAVMHSIAQNRDVLDGRLGGLRLPVLVVWGAQDQLIPVTSGERFAREIAGSRLAVIPQCGHVPQLERPTEFVGLLREFLATAPGSRSS